MISFLTAEHEALKAQAQKAFAGLEPKPDVPETDAALAARVKALGYYGYLVPSAYGGVAPKVDLRALCVLREEMAYRSAAADSLFAVQGLGSHPVVLGGDEQQKQRWLPQVVDGRALFAFALTEPNAGSDVAAVSTRAVKEGDAYVLDGAKRFISNAGVATHYTVFARTSEGPKGLSAFVVPADAKGLRIRPMALLGEHPIGELSFDGCRVSASARLGQEGHGMRLALGTLDLFRSTVGAAAIGMARRALDEALSYARSRHQFGAPLADLQGVQFLLADSAVELDASRLLVHRAAATKDAGAERVTYEAAVAKLFSTEAAQRIIDRCLQVHGGVALVRGHPLERLYRDIRALRIYEGASDVQRVVISRQLLGNH